MTVKELAEKLNRIVAEGKGDYDLVDLSNNELSWIYVEYEYENTVTIGHD